MTPYRGTVLVIEDPPYEKIPYQVVILSILVFNCFVAGVFLSCAF